LPPLVAAKLALYEAMRAQGITRTELARQLGLQENAVRRLLDLDHRSHIDQIDRALAALGMP
jgi:antitoxin HicB